MRGPIVRWMDPVERTLSGLDYLTGVTSLLQRVRNQHPTAGVWEAADFQWWWRKPRETDSWDQLFWFDDAGDPVAAAVLTDWGERLGLDILTLPGLAPDLRSAVWRRALESLDRAAPMPAEVAVDDADGLLVSLLESAGFVALPHKGGSAWMKAEDAPSISDLTEGYELLSRSQIGDTPHHMSAGIGEGVAERLQQTSLYRPDLDLVVADTSGDPAAYGLFWYDPVTTVGFVEPMETYEPHQRQGLARHVLTSGIQRLTQVGASRIRINYEQDNEASRTLYLDSGFAPTMTTSLYVRAS